MYTCLIKYHVIEYIFVKINMLNLSIIVDKLTILSDNELTFHVTCEVLICKL